MSVSAGTVIIHTSDGGQNWTREQSNTSFNLNDVSVSIASGTAVSVGDGGVILRRTADGIWTDVSPDGLSADLYSVAAGVSVIMVCGAGGTLLSSFDDGDSWRIWSEFGHEDVDLLSVNFDLTHPNSFLITGENGFIYSSEKGVVNTGDNTDFIGSCGRLCNGLPDMVVGRNGAGYFLNSSLGFTVGEGVFTGTTGMVSGGSRYITVGENGQIHRLEQDGLWNVLYSGTTENLNGICSLSWGDAICTVGDNGIILVSHDDGTSWQTIDAGIRADLTAVSGNGSGEGFAVGRNIVSGVFSNLPFGRETSR